LNLGRLYPIDSKEMAQGVGPCSGPGAAACQARRELAQHYLLHSSLKLTQTAYLLGYEDADSFFRVFHQWEGTSPGEWRAVHAHRVTSNHAPASVA
jgi:AraC-like DNA-binding protein